MDEKHYIWGISQKEDGQMKLYPDTLETVLTNRKNFFDKMGLDSERIVLAGLIHGDHVEIVSKENAGQKIESTDGLITAVPNVILAITVADCLPIYFFDKVKGLIGLAHAGWRGVAKNIVFKMLNKMRTEFGTNPRDVSVSVGPHIKGCHFEIKEDVAEQFAEYQDFITRDKGKVMLDLGAVVVEQLKRGGVPAENISVSDECTYHLDKKYYSFRRDRPERVEAMIAYTAIKG